MTLTERINEIGESILATDAELQTAREQDDIETAAEVAEIFVERCVTYREIINAIPIPKGRIQEDVLREIAQEDDDYLALTVFDHDLVGVLSSVTEMGCLIKRGHGDFLHKFLTYYDTALPTVLMISYLATGDKKFLTDIPCDNIVDRLTTRIGEANIDFDPHSHKTIPSDLYFAAVQLVKNARQAFYLAKKENKLPEDADDVISFGSNLFVDIVDPLQGKYCVYVIDEGPGIAQENLPKIFGSYSTTGSGIGLQVVKKIADMRDGHIVVVSALPGQPGYSYDTDTGKTEERGIIKSPGNDHWHGSQFMLHLNRHV